MVEQIHALYFAHGANPAPAAGRKSASASGRAEITETLWLSSSLPLLLLFVDRKSLCPCGRWKRVCEEELERTLRFGEENLAP